ncbi:MAG: PadR family transcriptional regulator [Chloroflexota bacterium]
MSERSQSARGLLSLTVLALLVEQPRHPYDIQRLIRQRHKSFAEGKWRSLYHAVDELQKQHFIEPAETSREGKRPERTVYRITEEGAEEFADWLKELLESPRDEHPTFTAAVSFLGYLPRATVLDALRSRAVSLQSEVAALNAALHALCDEFGLPRLVVLEHECARALKEAELQWTRSIIADIDRGVLAWDPEHLGDLFVGAALRHDREAALGGSTGSTIAAVGPGHGEAASHHTPSPRPD